MANFGRARWVGLLGGCLSLACGGSAGEGENASESESAITVDHYRYHDELLEVSSVPEGEGRRLLEGPDNARLMELLGAPSAGIVVDPTEERLFWITLDEADRTNAVEEIKGHLVLKPADFPVVESGEEGDARAGTLDPLALGVGCLTPGTTLFDGANLSGAQLSVRGNVGDLRPFAFDNRPSSLTFVSGITALFENLNFTGHSIAFVPDLEIRRSTCSVSQPFGQINSLSSYVMTSTLWIFKTSWDNQATSASFAQTQF
jgi:hypothetical protein